MTSWIEPPPKQKGMGCLGKGCVMFFIFIILLAAAFFIGGYAGVRYVVTSTEPREIPPIESSEAEQHAVKERWEEFKSSANMPAAPVTPDAPPPVEGETPTPAPSSANRIDLTASDINSMIAGSRKLNGKAFVSIENNVARIQVSVPLEKVGFRGRFLNGQFEARAAADGNPRNLEITEVSLGGVSEKVLNALLGFRSVRSYVDQYASEYDIRSLKIENNTVIIEHGGGRIPGR